MDSKGFKDIEDFYEAYKERLQEYLKIKEIKEQPKMLMMHLGGIVIETCLKDIVKREKSAEKVKGSLWYTIQGFEAVKNKGNLKKGEFKPYSCCENPGHKIEKIIGEIRALNDILTDNPKIIEDIKIIQNPLEEESEDFIGLRYKASCNIDDFDSIFTKWDESFERLLKWIIKSAHNIEV